MVLEGDRPALDVAAGRGHAAGMETYNVVNVVAAITIGFVVIRGLQAAVEHYFPDSDPCAVMRFLYGGPS